MFISQSCCELTLTYCFNRLNRLLAILLVLGTKTLNAHQIGLASWYGPRFHGRRAASGEVFNQHQYTAAHRRLPFGTQVKVTNLGNGKSVLVRINDRGPYVKGRIVDLSRAAANDLGMTEDGTVRVKLEVVKEGQA